MSGWGEGGRQLQHAHLRLFTSTACALLPAQCTAPGCGLSTHHSRFTQYFFDTSVGTVWYYRMCGGARWYYIVLYIHMLWYCTGALCTVGRTVLFQLCSLGDCS